jgi:membrane-bound serine protease (ClpP class)
MRQHNWCLPLGALLVVAPVLATFSFSVEGTRAYVIPVEGDVDPVMLKTLERRIGEATSHPGVEYLFFDIDSYGGRVDSAESIANLIDSTPGPRKVAFVSNKALSAGAFIAIACDEIVMQPNATLGNCMPVMPTFKGIETVDEKMESGFRAKLVSYGEDRGYPAALTAAMVTPGFEILRVPGKEGTEEEFVRRRDLESWSEYELRQRRIVDLSDPLRDGAGSRRFAVILESGDEAPLEVVNKSGELLTLDGKKAAEYGFARFIASDLRGETLKLYNIPPATVRELPVLWWESVVKILNSLPAKIILLALGLLGFFIEAKVPGFGLPGILGLACFALLFFGAHLAGLAEWIEILMFAAGVVLIVLEVFVIPGFGVAGIAGILLLFSGLILALVSFGPTRLPTTEGYTWYEVKEALATLFGGIGSFFVGMIVLIRFLPKTPVLGRIMHTTSLSAEKGYATEVKEGESLVGRTGVALTVLRPAGKIEVDGVTHDAAAQGEFIERGDRVEIVDTSGNRIIVRKP